MREAKRKESQRQKVPQAGGMSVSQRSKDRRKVVEDRKDNKKVSALQDLKARREERRKQGKLYSATPVLIQLVLFCVFQFLYVFMHNVPMRC